MADSKARKYSKVSIDGVQYAPAADRSIDEEARKLLAEVYGSLWAEAFYDPMNESTKKFAEPLSRKMTRLNELLGFRQ